MMSRKGFLFTISIIFVASTLIFFAQEYSSKNLAEQSSIVFSYKPTLEPFTADDISRDLLAITELSISDSFSDSNIIISISDSIQKSTNLSTAFVEYASFLDTNYFQKIQGTESINILGFTDGTYDANIGDTLVYSNNYNNTLAHVLDFNGTRLKSIDLNIFSEGDLNSYSWSASGTGVNVTIRFFGDSNYVIINSSVSQSGSSTLDLYHDNNVLDRTTITIGSVLGNNSSIMVDSNAMDEVSFSMDVIYSGFSSTVPIDLNVLFTSTSDYVSSNSLIRVQK